MKFTFNAAKDTWALTKLAFQDKVDMIVMGILLLVSILDLFDVHILAGGYAFFLVYTFVALLRKTYWQRESGKKGKS